ncbi:zwei Ig domain protein zig-8-like [Arctopsyche grandis]|uniref:zwei Ig domain protein zig-8-like n=1 Tax=Arctopsyche grandis TaxID=121162 RepID=UPI00406DA068
MGLVQELRSMSPKGVMPPHLPHNLLLVFNYPNDPHLVTLSSDEIRKFKQKASKDNATFQADSLTPINITVQLGSTAYLPCKVRKPKGKPVSFIRKIDSHILTVERYTFVADERFTAFFTNETDTWNLQIKYAHPSDIGIYECQISTEPKISRFIQLNVIVPKTKMEGLPEVYVKAGSTVNLRCTISRTLEEPAYIFWYQDSERVLNNDRSFISMERLNVDTIVSQLTIHNTRRKDSGNYSCNPSNLQAANTILHVLNGEQPAAMQHGNSGWWIARGEGSILCLSLAVLRWLVA